MLHTTKNTNAPLVNFTEPKLNNENKYGIFLAIQLNKKKENIMRSESISKTGNTLGGIMGVLAIVVMLIGKFWFGGFLLITGIAFIWYQRCLGYMKKHDGPWWNCSEGNWIKRHKLNAFLDWAIAQILFTIVYFAIRQWEHTLQTIADGIELIGILPSVIIGVLLSFLFAIFVAAVSIWVFHGPTLHWRDT